MERRIEILAPAGSYESLKAAVSEGADAVYIGGSRFGARAYADNLDKDCLLEAIDYVHLHGRKIYLTVNTLLKEKEVSEELYDYLLPYYTQGLDAVIVQDMGVLKFVKEHFPELPIHASTQMTIANVSGAEFMESLGVERIVTSREMSLSEIREIAEKTNIEIESFVHGALCYCYSGQCLYSSLVGGRSGNRGQCAQPCRLPYRVNGKTSYIMSLKDMCALDMLPELIEAGIYSFKIEGRMKKPEYVAAVVSIYRKYVELYFEKGGKDFRVSEEDREILMDLYNRGGFHSGYYKMRNGREMLSLNRPNHAGVSAVKLIKQQGREVTVQSLRNLHKGDVLEMPDKESYTLGRDAEPGTIFSLNTRCQKQFPKGTVLNRTRNEKLLRELKENIVERKVKEKINGKLILFPGKHAKLELFCNGISVLQEGETVQEALSHPMERARIEKQMRKTGGTDFEFDSLHICMEGDIFIPMQSLNELRRQGLGRLKEAAVSKYRRSEYRADAKSEETGVWNSQTEGFYVYVEQKEQFEAVLEYNSVKRIYIDCNIVRSAWNSRELNAYIRAARAKNKEIYFAMPYILRKEAKNLYDRFFEAFEFDGVLLRNYDSYQFLMEKAPGVKAVLDCNMYQFNKEAKAFWKERGIAGLTAPVELNYRELKELGCEECELIVYGYLQMMVSAQCIRKTVDQCVREVGFMKMTDRYHKEFVIKSCCDYCYNVIYNTEALSLIDQRTEITDLSPAALRLHFTLENAYETKAVMKSFEDVFVRNRRVDMPEGGFTRGHFRRGIK